MYYFLFWFHGLCQTVPDNNSSGQVKVYDSYQPEKRKSLNEKNKISINPLGIAIGDYSLYYERMLITTFSLEVGLGVTYENYLGNFVNFMGSKSYSNSDVERTYQLGSTYSISPKLYLYDDRFDDTYLAFCYRHRLYKDEATAYQGQVLSEPMKESYKLNSYTINWGKIYDLGKGFIFDCYIGIGLRTVIKAEVVQDHYNSFKIENSKNIYPTGMAGFKLGYIF